MVCLFRCENSIVTDFYLDVIGKMFSGSGEKISEYRDSLPVDKEQIIVVATETDFIKIYKAGYRKIVFWMQGIAAEESYLKHKSNLRKFVLDAMTRFTLKKASAVFFVSAEMMKYEEHKFRLSLENKSFVMPCFNVSKEQGIYFDSQKYKQNVFAYVGSLSKWQCFTQTIDFYKKIEEKRGDVELRVFTFSVDQANKLLEERGIKNYSVTSVPPDQMTEALRDVKFGFVLRDDIAVNNVATPTKLSSYLSAGVIPVYSTALKDFHEKTKGMHCFVPVDDYAVVPNKLYHFIENGIDFEVLKKEYSELFDTYYNPDYYIEVYAERIHNLVSSFKHV